MSWLTIYGLTRPEEQKIQQEVITDFEDDIDNMVRKGLQEYPHVDPATTRKEIENGVVLHMLIYLMLMKHDLTQDLTK